MNPAAHLPVHLAFVSRVGSLADERQASNPAAKALHAIACASFSAGSPLDNPSPAFLFPNGTTVDSLGRHKKAAIKHSMIRALFAVAWPNGDRQDRWLTERAEDKETSAYRDRCQGRDDEPVEPSLHVVSSLVRNAFLSYLGGDPPPPLAVICSLGGSLLRRAFGGRACLCTITAADLGPEKRYPLCL